MSVWLSWLVVVMFALSSFGCGGAEWNQVEIDSPYEVPKTVTISVGSPPELREPARTLASALADELQSRGIATVTLPPGSGAAEINLELYRWDSQSKEFSWTRPSTAKGTVTVVVETATIGVQGTVSGFRNGGGTVIDAASAAGHLIGRTIATGHE